MSGVGDREFHDGVDLNTSSGHSCSGSSSVMGTAHSASSFCTESVTLPDSNACHVVPGRIGRVHGLAHSTEDATKVGERLDKPAVVVEACQDAAIRMDRVDGGEVAIGNATRLRDCLRDH